MISKQHVPDTSGILNKPLPVHRSLLCLSPSSHIVLCYAVALLGMSISGSMYSFSAWSTVLKTQLKLTQPEIERIGLMGNVGAYTGPLMGILVSVFSPQLCGLISTFFMFCGYFGMHLAVSESSTMTVLQHPTIMGVLFMMSGFASGLLHCIGLAINVFNLPRSMHGGAIALLTAVYGLSSFFFTTVYTYVFDKHIAPFLLCSALVNTSICLLNSIVMRRFEKKETEQLNNIQIVQPGQLQHLLIQENEATTLTGASTNSSDQLHSPPSNTTLSSNPSNPFNELSTPKLNSMQATQPLVSINENKSNAQLAAASSQVPILQRVIDCLYGLITSSSFWLLFFAFILTTGPGLMTINNVGSFVKTYNDDEEDKSLVFKLMLLLSLCNACGRLMMSISDVVYVRRGFFLTAACGMTLLGNLCLLLFVREASDLYVPIAFCMLGYGFLWAIVPILISDLFGCVNYSMNFGWLAAAPAIGTFIYNHMAGEFYRDSINESTVGKNNANDCVGSHCFSSIWIVNCVSCIVALLLSLLLVPRTVSGRVLKEQAKQVA